MNDGIEKEKGQWINAIIKYRMKLEMSWDDLRAIDRKSLKEKKIRHTNVAIRNVSETYHEMV